MFGLFRKKKPETALDQFIHAVYGNPPPPKRADVESAIALAENDLLAGVVDSQNIRSQALALSAGPVPYSTQDLALAVALHFFKQPSLVPQLAQAQLMARMNSLEWLQDGLVVPVLAKSFEDTLYAMYKPG